MRDGAARRPGAVPDDDEDVPLVPGAEVWRGVDTDGDGQADTLLTVEGADLLVQTDLDGDGLADRVLRIGADGAVHTDVSPSHLERIEPTAWSGLAGPDP